MCRCNCDHLGDLGTLEKKKNLTQKPVLSYDLGNFNSNNEQSQLLKLFLSTMSFGSVLSDIGLHGRVFQVLLSTIRRCKRKSADDLSTLGLEPLGRLCLCLGGKRACLGNDDFVKNAVLMRFCTRKRIGSDDGAFARNRNNRTCPFENEKDQSIPELSSRLVSWICNSCTLQSRTSLWHR